MLIVIGVIIASLFIFCVVEYNKTHNSSHEDGFGWWIGAFFAGAGVLNTLAVAAIFTSQVVTQGPIIDAKLAMRQEENQKIEAAVDAVIKEYLDHEEKVYAKGESENSIVTITMAYPKLASSELVKDQIKLYRANEEEIMSLKNQKINLSEKRFWLYFGK